MKLAWTDLEAHRDAATPAQWRRIEAYFLHGKRIGLVARDDGLLIDGSPRGIKAARLSIGSGLRAVVTPAPGNSSSPTIALESSSSSTVARPVSCAAEPVSSTEVVQEQPVLAHVGAVIGAPQLLTAGVSSEREGALALAFREALAAGSASRHT